MNATIALVILQFLITMMFCPLHIGAKGHASLARDRIEMDLSIFRIPLIRLRIRKNSKAFSVVINGKPIGKGKNPSIKNLSNVIYRYKLEGIKTRGNILALIGADDAKNTALAYAVITGLLQPIIKNLSVYTAQPPDTFEIDGRVGVKINLIQIAGLISAGLKGR